jgi:hypothetical protein
VGPLAAVFAALLAGCSGRDLPGEEDSEGHSGGHTTGGTTGDPTDATSSSGPTSAPEPTSGSGSASASGPSSDPSGEPNTTSTDDCVYSEHEIVLTPEAYEDWLDGEGPVGGTDTDGTDTDGTGGTAGTTADTTGEGTSTGVDTDASTTGGGVWSFEVCVAICVALTGTDEWDIVSCDKQGFDAEGNVVIACTEIVQHCDGRSHACITSSGARRGDDPVGDHFARAAHDEAASVFAFAALAAELAAHGAPAELLARIAAATADEVRHAQAVAGLAAARGARCPRPAREPVAPRSLREIAVENAVEGCVRETWAALLAAHQAAHAEDPEVRRVMREIAADEARHAELAWAIDAWLRSRLDAADVAAVEAARAAAAEGVVAGAAARTPAPALVREGGVPGRERAARLARGLATALWAP